MDATYQCANGRLTFKVSGENPKALFKEIATIQDLFEAESSCGCCQGESLKYQARQVDEYDFFELVCLNPDCRARFSFGQHKKGGGLFPKRKSESGDWLPNRGWSRYIPKHTEE